MLPIRRTIWAATTILRAELFPETVDPAATSGSRDDRNGRERIRKFERRSSEKWCVFTCSNSLRLLS